MVIEPSLLRMQFVCFLTVASHGNQHDTAERRLLPQSFRHALPAVTNDFVALLKDSSLVSVITVVELTKRMTIAAVEVRGWLVPGLVCAALYFAMSFPLARLSRRLEKRLHRDPNPRTT